MCLVIDTCTIPKVFDQSNKEHERFAPVLKWVTQGDGRLIYGGQKYNAELRRLPRYIKIIVQLARGGRVVELPNTRVDQFAAKAKAKVADRAFNDEHLVALVAISKCHVICTDDEAAHPYLKRPDLYPSKVKPPKIYRHASHRTLCCGHHIVEICR